MSGFSQTLRTKNLLNNALKSLVCQNLLFMYFENTEKNHADTIERKCCKFCEQVVRLCLFQSHDNLWFTHTNLIICIDLGVSQTVDSDLLILKLFLFFANNYNKTYFY